MRAFVKLKKDSHFSDVQLVVVGKKAWMFDDIMKESADNNKDIILTDYVSNEDLVRLYNLADGFVYPSFYEGFGIPPLEAMACGTPVAVANATSLPEVVGDAGMYFDPFSEEEITNSIVKLLDEDKAIRDEKRIERGLCLLSGPDPGKCDKPGKMASPCGSDRLCGGRSQHTVCFCAYSSDQLPSGKRLGIFPASGGRPDHCLPVSDLLEE